MARKNTHNFALVSISHEIWMQRCLDLAKLGLGRVSPNPMVGCVIVHEGKIIADGWHKMAGEAHAEREAILKISGDPRLKESTLYVNLEPCAHFGRTPPCANLIVDHEIPEVVYGCADPFAAVNGKGLDFLRSHGVKVIGPVLEQESRFLNRRFFTIQEKKRPYIILKWAQTADGFIAPPDKSKFQISGDAAKKLLHRWRAEEDSVLVGSGTVVADNPMLDVRLWEGRNPLRVIYNPHLKGNLISELPTIIFNSIKNEVHNQTEFIQLFETNFIESSMKYLMDKGVQSVLVEGGAETINRFISSGEFDEIRVIKSKKVKIGSGLEAPKWNLIPQESTDFGDDVVEIQYIDRQ